MSDYRIRQAVVEVCNGWQCWRDKRFIAERRIRFLGLIDIWWPVADGAWRESAKAAKRDLEHDNWLRSPLSKPIYFSSQ
jgi:hypothetical protein